MKSQGLPRRVRTNGLFQFFPRTAASLKGFTALFWAAHAGGLLVERVEPAGPATASFDRVIVQFSSPVQDAGFSAADIRLLGPGDQLVAAAAILAGSLASTVAAAAEGGPRPLKILGISCSPRKGMTTAKAVQAALDAARAVEARIQTELIDLGGLNIAGWSPAIPRDDFDAIPPKLQDPRLCGLIIGSPSYFRSLSALCRAFIERCMPLREGKMVLANKPVGALAVGGNRNGGQELVVQQILIALLIQSAHNYRHI